MAWRHTDVMLKIVERITSEEFNQEDRASGGEPTPPSRTDDQDSPAMQDMDGGPRAQVDAGPAGEASKFGRAKVIAFAALGHAYACAVLITLTLFLARMVLFIARAPDPAVVFVICAPVLLMVLAFLQGSVKAVWIRTPAPEGIELTPDDSPWLFETLKLIGLEIRGPKIHRVLLTGDLHASVDRRPHLGVFGLHENCLVLGLPLLQALSARQMLAVIVREYALMSGRPDRPGSWVCEARASWAQAADGLAGRRGFTQALLARFILWYAPRLRDASASMARAHELGADRCSADIAGRDQAAAALVRSEVIARYLQEGFWPEVESLMDDLPEPVPSVYTSCRTSSASPWTR
jgi:hypothetical protein